MLSWQFPYGSSTIFSHTFWVSALLADVGTSKDIDFENGERIMIRKISASILLLTILVSCAAPATGTPTQVEALESPPPPTLPVMADIGDGGLLSGLPCAAPCVYGIRTGET